MPPMLARALPCRKSTQHKDRCEEKGNARREEIFTWEEKMIPWGRRSKQSTKIFCLLCKEDLWTCDKRNEKDAESLQLPLNVNGKCLKLRQIPFSFKLSQAEVKVDEMRL